MKTLLMYFQIVLLMCGVFDADADEVRSVMEGDSVTLNPDLSQIQGFNEILWRFGEKGFTIAQIDGNVISYEDIKIFKDRLQLNQTGSLTITNVRTNQSGLYEAEIRHKTGTLNQKFSVTVYESPSVIAGAEAEMKSVSVMEGDPVTLHVPQIQGDELIVWRFGDEGKLIAKADLEAKSSPLYYDEERFKDRLKLDQTGSLIITNTRTTDSGEYKVKISSNKQTLYKRFTLTVAVPDSGYSGAAVAGIVVGVLLAVAVAAGVKYYLRPRTTNLPNQTWSVLSGQHVTLDPETKLQTGDEILWLFRDEEQKTVLGEIKKTEVTKYAGTDWRFRDRLELKKETGKLTITNFSPAHDGYYMLKITRGRETLYKRFYICVSETKITKTEGESVYLEPARKIKKDDVIQWLFGDEEQQTLIAELKVKTGEILTRDDVADGIFRDRLKLDETTGDLTIKNMRTEHSGVYNVQIRSSSGVSEQIFSVTVYDKVEEKLLNKGDSVTLKPDPEIQRDDLILWMFGDQDKLIAQIKGGTPETYDGVNKRFRGRLELDKMTGSLTITKIEAKHTGLYKLQIISSGGILVKRFKVSIKPRNVEVTAGDSVRLHTGLNEIHTDDEIEWRFGDKSSLIAEIKGGTGVTHDVPDERFRDRLELNKKTGDLIINDSRAGHAGRYKLKISSSEGNTNMTYRVFITDAAVTKEAREKSSMNQKNDCAEKRENESATVEMPLLNGDYVNVVNEEEGTSSL